MFGTLVIIFILIFFIFLLGFTTSAAEDDEAKVVTTILTFCLIGVIMLIVIEQTDPISAAKVSHAIRLCDINGGLNEIDQRIVICKNGVTLETDSLLLPEKE